MQWIKIIQIIGLSAGIVLKAHSIYSRVKRMNSDFSDTGF